MASLGVVLVGAGLAYQILERTLMRADGEASAVGRAVGVGGKEWLSIALYVSAIPGAFVWPYYSIACYVLVSIPWVIPDRQFERDLRP